jgi:16S rRNA (cytosine967-C5)-methyltransferase
MSASARAAEVSAARACAFAVVRRVFEQGAYADRAFAAAATGLDARDRAFAMQLAYGTVQRRATLDHICALLSRRDPGALEPPVLAALRLGLFQLLLLGAVPDHAAVNESVELAKRSSRGGAPLVNAVLRRAAREGRAILDGLDDRTSAGAALLHSVPEWLAERWFAELGADDARALLRRINAPAESVVRANSLVTSADEALARLPVPAMATGTPPEAIVLDAAFDTQSSELWREGAIMPQSRASMLVSHVLAPAAGERVLDLCAAPGAKTTHLAALMRDRGELVAVERHPGRADALARTCDRMRARCVRIVVGDAAAPRAGAAFDKVLVDPPCSGLGTLQSRPDIRWRATPDGVAGLAAVQQQILAAGASATAPGGAIVYSVCTISRQEGQEVIERFLRERPEFTVDEVPSAFPGWSHPSDEPYLQLLPHRDGTDGFFIARLRRA